MTRTPLPTESQPQPSSPTTRPVRALGAVTASLVTIPIGITLTGGSAAAAVPTAVPSPPKPSVSLPAELDFAPKYQEGWRCLSGDLPGPTAFAQLLNATYGRHVYGINRTCAAEHGEGRALDWMVNANDPNGLAVGNAITRWLSAPDSQGRPGAMARRLGINYIIWNRQQWRSYDPARGWAAYTGSSPHTDHIHISFTWDGAYKQTSWWTGKALTSVRYTGPTSGATSPVPVAPPLTATGYPLLKRGDTGKDVMLAQGVLGITKDGSFGPMTESTLASWQSRRGVPVTKQLDNATWTKMIQLGLVPARNGGSSTTTSPLSAYVNTVLQRGSRGTAVIALQKALRITADGSFGPATQAAVIAFQKSKGISATGVVATATWNALIAATATSPTAHPLAPYATTTLRRGSTGAAVVALQKALRITADGSFGPATEAAVIAYQKSKGISPTGVVATSTWNALMGQTSTGTPTTTTPPATTSTSTEFTPYKSTVLRRGSTGTAVKVLQSGLGGVAVDGAFGPGTQSRVISFQKSVGLAATGVVDRATWDKVELKVHPLLPWWNTVAKRGSRGSNVVALQKALRITADGSFGPATEAAVKAAQTRARIASTGVVATLTWKAIEKQM
ncbi:peptidoglycan hydrolase-like protein with peptidoglycan-binding domain [Knoellia remsis]|uniref:Peptidoglycan hydrolase-like protein with peptidoglycan-binding domain n=1 Tax=Knoellia remsis TaxID=407159 RepID=A0A2T0UDB7_9MICO|nr:peptidoglycan-binding protein [Knoellia remsis]PRY55858.1 peptidoglycan hydrolase-like protein with peptidoglycan-binding domain [Knoellia remsis]